MDGQTDHWKLCVSLLFFYYYEKITTTIHISFDNKKDIDSGINWGDPSITFKQVVDSGYNLIILSFLVSGKQYDAVSTNNKQNW